MQACRSTDIETGGPMAEKIPVPFADDVADTLLITLYMRKLESQRKNGIIDDPMAAVLVDSIDYDFSKYDKAWKSQLGTSIRVRHFDECIRRFVAENDNPVVVSVGAGVDTRFQRVYDGKGVFYELDLPEVIDFRRRLLPESEPNPYLPYSMFDTEWITMVTSRHPGAKFAVVAEGVFMFFAQERIKPLVVALAEGFGNGEMHFDACGSFGVRSSRKHDAIKHTNASFRWGLERDEDVCAWSQRIRHVGTEYFMDKERRRWGVFGLVFGAVPRIGKCFRMLHYRMEPASA